MTRKITNRFTTSVFAGDVSDIFYLSPYVDGDGTPEDLTTQAYTCNMYLITAIGAVASVTKAVTAKSTDNMYFECVWEPADTSGLTAGTYIWVIEIAWASASPIFNKEYHIDLVVKAEGNEA